MKEINLTEGHILQKIISFSLPMIAGNLLQQIYNIVDTLIVGRCIGPDALASVSSSYTLMIFITSIIIGLCMGSGAFFLPIMVLKIFYNGLLVTKNNTRG